MAAHKRTKMQRDRQLVEMTKMWVLGHSQREIAKKFGITQPQVCHDLKEIRDRLLPEDTQQMKEARADRMMDLAMFKLEFLEEWERSKRDKETQTQEKISIPGKGKKGETSERIKAALRTEGKCANPAFLNGAVKVVQEECKIAGLYAPKKKEHNGGDKPLQIQFIEIGDVAPGTDSAPATANSVPKQMSDEWPASHHSAPSDQLAEQVPPPKREVLRIGDRDIEVVCPQEELQKALSEFADECGKQKFKKTKRE